MKFKRLSAIFSATVLSVSSLFAMGFAPLVHATAGSDTCTWTGASSNFNSSANWSGCSGSVPVNGDNLIFNNTSLSGDATVTNDISGLTLGSITFSGTNSGYYGFTLTGSALSLSGGITSTETTTPAVKVGLTLTADQTFSDTSGLTIGDSSAIGGMTLAVGSHTLTFAGTGDCDGEFIYDAITGTGSLVNTKASGVVLSADSPGFTGTITSGTGTVYADSAQALGASSAATTITSGGTLWLGFGDSGATVANPLTLGGTGNGDTPTVVADDASGPYCAGGAGSTETPSTVTLTGAITLQSDITIGGFNSSRNIAITGAISGSHNITVATGSQAKLTINSSSNNSSTPNGTLSAPAQTITVAAGDNQPNQFLSVGNNVTAIVDGQRGGTDVQNGGILQGGGQVDSLYVESGGTVAPGHSPGTLTVVTTLGLTDGAIYQAQLKDAAAGDYDQIVVGAATDTTPGTHDVTLGTGAGDTDGPTLNVSLYDGYKMAAGDQFEIINNLSKTSIDGTFKNLPEGATFKVGTAVFKISYVGGDGNDVVLTVVTAPTTPDTGFAMVSAHPGATLGVTILAAGVILGIAQKTRRTPVRVKATASRRRR